MEARELRIGNLLYAVRAVDRVALIEETSVKFRNTPNLYNLVGGGSLVKPIPLTEKWLLRFGFQKPSDVDQGDFHCTVFQHQKTGLNLSFYLGNFYDCSINFEVDHVNVQHVHQLQNLYFALTGEELTIEK